MDLFGDFSTSTDNSLPPELGFSALKSEANLQKSAQPAQKEEDSALSVTQLTGLIKTMLEGSFSSVFIKGEISNFKPSAGGHAYFVLKDSDSQISAVMWRGKVSSLNFIPKDGMLVYAQGQISVYAPRGNYQIIVNSMRPAGTGGIMEMIEERKQRLMKEGLFDNSRKKALPLYPSRIGVVTSPTGAALRDILQITKRRNNKMSVTVFPAVVQGEEAASSIIRQIQTANRYNMCDVLIVGRGGGSLEDLLPFSDEGVVRAIAASRIPVISAVGHEIDFALSDYAADLRAPTPSAAAELCVPVKDEILSQLEETKNELYNAVTNKLEKLRLTINSFKPENLEKQFRYIEQPLLMRYDNAKENLTKNMQDYIENLRRTLKEKVQILESCNPQTIFDRGYSMVTDAETGKVIRSSEETQAGRKLVIRPSVGKIDVTVDSCSK